MTHIEASEMEVAQTLNAAAGFYGIDGVFLTPGDSLDDPAHIYTLGAFNTRQAAGFTLISAAMVLANLGHPELGDEVLQVIAEIPTPMENE